MERMVGQNNRLVSRLAGAGVTLRSDVRRHERAITRIEENLAEATDKLNGLIDIVNKSEKWQARAEEKLARSINSRRERRRTWQRSPTSSTRSSIL